MIWHSFRLRLGVRNWYTAQQHREQSVSCDETHYLSQLLGTWCFVPNAFSVRKNKVLFYCVFSSHGTFHRSTHTHTCSCRESHDNRKTQHTLFAIMWSIRAVAGGMCANWEAQQRILNANFMRIIIAFVAILRDIIAKVDNFSLAECSCGNLNFALLFVGGDDDSNRVLSECIISMLLFWIYFGAFAEWEQIYRFSA